MYEAGKNRMKRIHWWLVLVLFSVGVVWLDIITGPYILFPIMFVIPVYFAAWHLGRWPGIGFAFMLVGSRFVIAMTIESELMPAWAAALNACIRLLVLVGLSLLIDTLARQKRSLADRVQALEGILPICSYCKKIRRPDGTWEQIEVYIRDRSTAEFSHGLCETCAHEHYGKYYADSGH